jgi:uncharacterized membrane protein YkoI
MKAATIALVSMLLALDSAPVRADEDEAKEHANARIALGKAKLTMEQAVAAALKEVPGGKAVEAELELEGDDVVFEVEIVSGRKHMEVKLDAISGKVKEVEEEGKEGKKDEDEDEDEQAETDAAMAKVTLSQAIAAALKQVPGGKAFEAEAEREDGKLIFEIELLSGDKAMEVEVDAMTGKILEVEEEKE